MINRGLILTGTGYDLQSAVTSASSKLGLAETPHPTSPVEGSVQTIRMDVLESRYEPNHFVLRQGVPVKWVIDGKEVTECNRRIIVPKLGLEFDIKPGVQTIEFTPTETGVIPWSCWMGMKHGQFEVIAGPEVATAEPIITEAGTGSPSQPSAKDSAAPSPPTEQPPVLKEPPTTPATYKVAAGDTLAKIAVKLYGDAKKWREIAKANPHLNAKKLKAGQIIHLPSNLSNILTLTCCCESGDCGDNASPFQSATDRPIRKAGFTCEDARACPPGRATAAVCRRCGRSLPSSSR
jgi:LysM repeat protein